MTTAAIEVRPARREDVRALAEAHAEAWRGAYRGIIPAVTLERMVSRRGDAYWRAVTARPQGLLVLVFDGAVAGYAMLGRQGDAAGQWLDALALALLDQPGEVDAGPAGGAVEVEIIAEAARVVLQAPEDIGGQFGGVGLAHTSRYEQAPGRVRIS